MVFQLGEEPLWVDTKASQSASDKPPCLAEHDIQLAVCRPLAVFGVAVQDAAFVARLISGCVA